MRAKQLGFFGRPITEHGGEVLKPRRKTARPIDPKRAIHVVLRSSKARGDWSMLRPANVRRIDQTIREVAEKHDLRVYRLANVGNHLHLLVKTRTRKGFQGFLREISGRIAMLVTGSRKSHPVGKPGERFWDFLAYTRIVEWGRDFRNIELYFIKNLFEAAGLLTRHAKAAGLRVIPLARWGPTSAA